MAADPTALAAGLDDYRDGLARHLAAAGERFAAAERAWLGLAECYAGRGADEFRPAWEETARRFREYLDQSALLVGVLADKADRLRQADRPLVP